MASAGSLTAEHSNRPPTDCTVPLGIARLCLGLGILVRLVEFGLNPAFAVLFLPAQDLLHQGSLACLVLQARILAWFLAGAARRLFWLTHGQILLQPGAFGSVPSQIHRLATIALGSHARRRGLPPWFGLEADLAALRGIWRHPTGAHDGGGLADVGGQRGGIGQIRPVPYLFRTEDHPFGSVTRGPGAGA